MSETGTRDAYQLRLAADNLSMLAGRTLNERTAWRRYREAERLEAEADRLDAVVVGPPSLWEACKRDVSRVLTRFRSWRQ